MDGLELDIAQQRYYEDIFKICENDGGKIDSLKATELFRSAQLSNAVIQQVNCCLGGLQAAHMLDSGLRRARRRHLRRDGQGRQDDEDGGLEPYNATQQIFYDTFFSFSFYCVAVLTVSSFAFGIQH